MVFLEELHFLSDCYWNLLNSIWMPIGIAVIIELLLECIGFQLESIRFLSGCVSHWIAIGSYWIAIGIYSIYIGTYWIHVGI